MLCLPGVSKAQDVTRLTLEYIDGTKAHYVLSDKPVLTIEGTDLMLKSETAEAAITRSELSHFYFTKGTVAGIADVVSDDFTVSYLGNIVRISGSGVAGATVYDVSGKCMDSFSAIDGEVEADLNHLASGVYLVAIPGRPALKILVKH